MVFGPEFAWRVRAGFGVRLDALGILRSVGSLGGQPGNLGYIVNSEVRSASPRGFGGGVRAYSVAAPIERAVATAGAIWVIDWKRTSVSPIAFRSRLWPCVDVAISKPPSAPSPLRCGGCIVCRSSRSGGSPPVPRAVHSPTPISRARRICAASADYCRLHIPERHPPRYAADGNHGWRGCFQRRAKTLARRDGDLCNRDRYGGRATLSPAG